MKTIAETPALVLSSVVLLQPAEPAPNAPSALGATMPRRSATLGTDGKMRFMAVSKESMGRAKSEPYCFRIGATRAHLDREGLTPEPGGRNPPGLLARRRVVARARLALVTSV